MGLRDNETDTNEYEYVYEYKSLCRAEERYIKEIISNGGYERSDLAKEMSVKFECPRKWFKYDTWNIGSALLLLAGISPLNCEVIWDFPLYPPSPESPYYRSSNFRECYVAIESADLLEECQNFPPPPVSSYEFLGRKTLRSKVEDLFNQLDNAEREVFRPSLYRKYDSYDDLSDTAKEFFEASKVKRKYDFAERRLTYLYDMWESRLDADKEFNPQKRHPKEYYFDWLVEKNLQELVPWWDDAIENGYIASNIITEPQSTPQHTVQKSREKLLFMNSSYPFFAEELKIAVEAWTALYEKNPPQGTPVGGHKKYIISWLRKHHATLSTNAIDRISTLINPNRRGGASPTNSDN